MGEDMGVIADDVSENVSHEPVLAEVVSVLCDEVREVNSYR